MKLDAVLGELHEGLFERCRLRRELVENDGNARRQLADSDLVDAANRQGAVVFDDRRRPLLLERGLQLVELGRTDPDEALSALGEELVDRDLRDQPAAADDDDLVAVSAISLIRWLETKTVRPSPARPLTGCAPSGCRRGRAR